MPALGLLFQTLIGNLGALWVALETAKGSLRLTAVLILATAYVGCVTLWSGFVMPLLGSLFATAYGQLLGLLFPPISGTMIVGLAGMWACKIALGYTTRFAGMLLPK